jgi:hypothetical protein
MDARLGVVFAIALPLVLLVWSALRKEPALLRLMGIYWKVSSLLLIALLLLTDGQPAAFPLLVLAPLLIVVGLWFWVDLNEELADLPPWRGLPLAVRIWRWSVSFFAIATAALASTSLSCMGGMARHASCAAWTEAPLHLNGVIARVFGFLFGGQWTPGVAAFVGYVGLVAYAVGLTQWLLVRLPRFGRVAGEF